LKVSRTRHIVLIAIAIFAVAALGQERRPVTPEDVFRLKTVSDPQLSPDGKLVAYVVTTIDAEKNKRNSAIWVVSTDGSAEPRPFVADVPARAPRWSPDGKWLGFISNSPPPAENPPSEQPQPKPATPGAENAPKAQVWVVARDGSGRRRITNMPNGVTRFSWSPEGSRLAVISKDRQPGRKPSDVRAYTSMVYKSDGAGWFDVTSQNHIWIVDVKEGRAQQLTSGANRDDNDPEWSPDGKFIAYTAEESGAELREAFGSGDVMVIPSSGGAARSVCERHAYVASPRWSPDGTQLAYAAAPTPDDQPLLWITNVAAPENAQLASDADLFPTDVEWNDAGLWFGTRERGTMPIYRVNPAAHRATRIAGGDRTLHNFSVGEHDGKIAYLADDATHPGEVFIADSDGTHERQLTFHNRDLISQLQLSPSERVSWKGADGLAIEGFFKKPVGFNASQKYPMILSIHGGPNGMWGFQWSFDEQLYASNGYAVLMPNPRGSSGYGMQFQRAVAGEWGGKAYQDVINGVQAAASRNSWIDPDRLGVVGHSYGGFMTDWIVTQTSMFKAAIAISGISDFISVEGTRDGAFGHSRDFGGDLFTSFDNYWKYSAVRYAAKVRTPILFLHGEADNRVPPSQAEEYFRAIKHFGGTAELVLFPRENHGLPTSSEPKHLLETYRWRLYWFDRYVKGDLRAMAPDAAESSQGTNQRGQQ
jgi:dipeptidyl aminopeptidase/acylaminoacyl peptidase